MNKKIIFIIIGITFVIGFSWQVFTKNTKSENLKSLEQHIEKVKKKSVYVCPMHPQITSDKPGQECPICGMNLVLADEEEDDAGSAVDEHAGHSHEEHKAILGKSKTPENHIPVQLSDKKQQMIGIKLGKVTKEVLFKTINAPGRIAFDPDLYTAQSEYLEALRQWNGVKESPLDDVRRNTNEMIKSAKIRLRVLGLSDGQIHQLTQRGSQSEGLLVSGKGQETWVYADVFEVDLPHIKKGYTAEITANFLQGKALAGKVISVDQVINPETRTAKVRIQLQITDSMIRPESYVNVKILAPQGEHLTVPVEALMDTGKETFIYIQENKGSFEPRNINIILETESKIAILGDIKENDKVVIGGNFMLDSESRLKSVLRGGSHAH